jgi:hypothetical protein
VQRATEINISIDTHRRQISLCGFTEVPKGSVKCSYIGRCDSAIMMLGIHAHRYNKLLANLQ